MISREEAEQIARSYATAHCLGKGVQSVVLFQEITGRAPMIYGVKLDNCWIAYIEPIDMRRICSISVVVVDREHGKVIYGGSAGDEG